MTYSQTVGKVALSPGKKVAVGLGVDFDAISVWDGTFHLSSPSYQARGEFGAEVGVPRLLKLFKKLGITTTWALPGHTAETFTLAAREAIEAGHEIAHHGYGHENPTVVEKHREKEVIERGLEALNSLGVKPRGYRSPAWDFSPNTLDLLEEFGFEWDSSLMANDIYPYLPRRWSQPDVVQHGEYKVASGPAVVGEPSNVVEVPVTWYLDDFPTQEYIPGALEGLQATASLEQRWRDTFDFAAAQGDGAVFTLTIHPQTAGRPHMIMMIERLIEYMLENGGEFMTIGDIVDKTTFDK